MKLLHFLYFLYSSQSFAKIMNGAGIDRKGAFSVPYSWCYKTFFGGILENLGFPLSNQKQQELAILKAINSFRV